jgi:4-alpha-glucanotransferase
MRFPRSSGILLHPTSLPGRFGIGDLGPQARSFVDFLAASGQTLWQMLPLGPTGFGDSPYQCFSAFAGNPLLISLENLVERGWLDSAAIENPPDFPKNEVDFARVIPWKMSLLEAAARGFTACASARDREFFGMFTAMNSKWLDDFALFMALKQQHGGAAWTRSGTPPCANVNRERSPSGAADWLSL